MTELPLAGLKSYLRISLLEVAARYLGPAFEREEVAFHKADSAGGQAIVTDITPFCVALTGNTLASTLAEAYLPTLAREASETATRVMFRSLREQFARTIEAAPWLDVVTRRVVLAKLDAVTLDFIGDTDQDAGPAGPLPGSSFLAALRYVERSAWMSVPAKLGVDAPSSRAVAASFRAAAYLPRANAIWLSPEIVRSPFLRPAPGDPLSLGAIGTIIGYELAQAVSGRGRLYDASGAFRQTWSREALAASDEQAACLLRQKGEARRRSAGGPPGRPERTRCWPNWSAWKWPYGRSTRAGEVRRLDKNRSEPIRGASSSCRMPR